MYNEIYLRRKNKISLNNSVDNAISEKSVKYVATFLANINKLGYTLSTDIIAILLTKNTNDIVDLYKSMFPILQKTVGAHKKYYPMYPNFPQQVMEMSEAELYINAIMHYTGDLVGLRILPVYEKEERPELTEETKYKVINLGSDEDFYTLIKNLISSKTSISETDKEDIKTTIKNTENISEFLPEEIKHKEILAFVANEVFIKTNSIALIKNYFKTATDVLRFAVALSNGDVSLAKNTKFVSFKRKIRKMILSLLEQCNSEENILEDMFKHKETWLRLGERLHPFEYKNLTKCTKVFEVLRNKDCFNYKSFNSKVEESLVFNNVKESLTLLKTKPGEFARKLDKLLRDNNSSYNIVEAFEQVVDKVSTPVLLQVINHFNNRNTQADRYFLPKGNIAKLQTIENKVPSISASICDNINLLCNHTLVNRFSKLESLGNVYIDPKLKKYIVPFSQRSASKSLRTVVRSSRIDLEEGNVLRCFIWWKDLDSKVKKNEHYHYGDVNGTRVDIDLSAIALNKDFEYVNALTYYNLRNDDMGCHSGDITSAPNGACEFIDIDIDKCKKANMRYIVMNVNSFTGNKFCDIPECFAGWMIRQKVDSGQIFKGRTVQDKIDLTSESTMAVPLIIDLYTREVIWADMSVTQNIQQCVNVHNNKASIGMIVKAICNIKKYNLYDLFMLHALARSNKIVNSKEEADTVFSKEEGITPFDNELIMSEYL